MYLDFLVQYNFIKHNLNRQSKIVMLQSKKQILLGQLIFKSYHGQGITKQICACKVFSGFFDIKGLKDYQSC